ncbi:hypothetical protein ACLKA7_005478 [Drosophila subpalustris]
MRVKYPVRKPCPNSGASSLTPERPAVQRRFRSSQQQSNSTSLTLHKFIITWQRSLHAAPSDPVKKLLLLKIRGWATVCADFVGPLPRSKHGNTTILVFIDRFSKWTELVPLREARKSRDTPEGVQGEDSGKIRRPEGYGCEAPIHGTIHTTKKPYGLLLSSLARTAVRSDLLQKKSPLASSI